MSKVLITKNSLISRNIFVLNTCCWLKKKFSTKTKLDPYLILEINRQSDWKTIKKAYFKLARLYHPDLNKNDEVNIE